MSTKTRETTDPRAVETRPPAERNGPAVVTPEKYSLHGAHDAPPARGGRGWVWVVLLVGLAVGGYFLFRHLHAARPAEAGGAAGTGRGGAGRVTPVMAAAAVRGDLPLYLNGLGTVTALNTVTIRPRVDGQLDTVNFTEGQYVQQGDLLVQIDPRPFQAQLAQAEGQLAKDQSVLNNAKRDLQRDQEAADAISRQQLDTQTALVTQYEGAVKIDQAQIDTVKLSLSYARIVAPISGRVGLRLVDAGNMVHAADATGLAVITQLQPISVVFTLPQDDIIRVLKAKAGGTDLAVDAYDRDMKNKLAVGTLTAVDNQVEPTTGTVRMKATFPNDDGTLFPNQFVNARLLVETLHDVVLVPPAAVQRGPDATFVYVVGGETVSIRQVKLGPVEGEHAVVAEGLAPGELVVTDGVDKLQEGTKVAVRSGATTRPGRGGASGATRPAGEGRGRGRGGNAPAMPITRPAGDESSAPPQPAAGRGGVQ